jgi:hypothetical protein
MSRCTSAHAAVTVTRLFRANRSIQLLVASLVLLALRSPTEAGDDFWDNPFVTAGLIGKMKEMESLYSEVKSKRGLAQSTLDSLGNEVASVRRKSNDLKEKSESLARRCKTAQAAWDRAEAERRAHGERWKAALRAWTGRPGTFPSRQWSEKSRELLKIRSDCADRIPYGEYPGLREQIRQFESEELRPLIRKLQDALNLPSRQEPLGPIMEVKVPEEPFFQSAEPLMGEIEAKYEWLKDTERFRTLVAYGALERYGGNVTGAKRDVERINDKGRKLRANGRALLTTQEDARNRRATDRLETLRVKIAAHNRACDALLDVGRLMRNFRPGSGARRFSTSKVRRSAVRHHAVTLSSSDTRL